MIRQNPIVIVCKTNGITIKICHGEISDEFRLHKFLPLTEFELPDAKGTDEEFNDWLNLYRWSSNWFEYELLEESKWS